MAGLGVITVEGQTRQLTPRSTAPVFSSSASYAVGDLVYNDGTLYKCTTAHNGVWNASHFTAVTISGELQAKATEIEDLKSDLSDLEKITRVSEEYQFLYDGYVGAGGVWNPTASAKNTGYVPIIGLKSISYKVNIGSTAYGLAFFDANKNFIQSISITGGTSASVRTVNITSEILESAEYFVVSHYYADFITWSPVCFVTAEDDSFDSRINTLSETVSIAITENDLTSYVGVNKFNKDSIITGKEVYSDGTLKDESNSIASDFIYVHGVSFLYHKNLPSYSGLIALRYGHFYDENKSPIGSYVGIPRTDTEITVTVPSDAYYYRFSPYQRADTEALPIDYTQIMVTDEPTDDYIPYTEYLASVKGFEVPKSTGLDISGLKVVIFGDSITETANMNDDGSNYVEGYRHNWPEYVNAYMEWGYFRNYAKSGATYKDRGSGYEYRETVANQIALAIADSNNDDADIVVFSLGTNDGVSDLGSYETAMSKATLADLDQTKLYEALRYAYWTVRSKYKNAVCFSAIPIQRADIEPPTELYEAITKMAHRYDFIVINGAYESGIVKENNVWGADGNDLVDGLHPNTTGQIKIAKLYADTMVKQYLWRS